MHACFLLQRGLKTLPLRVRQQSTNALALAQFLEKQPQVGFISLLNALLAWCTTPCNECCMLCCHPRQAIQLLSLIVSVTDVVSCTATCILKALELPYV